MCGRYSLQKTVNKLQKRYGIYTDQQIDFTAANEIFPSQKVPIVTQNESDRQLKLFNWGFNPSFASNLIINARAETIDKKEFFTESFYNRRCLFPATHFFEWQNSKQGKEKYKISVKNQEIFSLAGIFDFFPDENDNLVPACCIITTTAAPEIRKIHHRMPVILTLETEKSWLNPEEKNTTRLKKCLVSYQGELSLIKE